MKKVTIAIRSYNDASIIGRVLDAILMQTFKDFDILIFDNSSTDSTLEVLKKYPQIKKIYQIPQGDYIPGKVLNFAASESECDVVVFNNSDSVALDENWLENLVRPILDSKASATYARQVARKDADVWVVKDYQNCFGDSEFSEYFFSAASSAFSKKILDEMKFDESLKYSEDILYTKKMRESGRKVLYVPNALVEHSHNYTLKELKKRIAGEGVADAAILGEPQRFLALIKGLLGGYFSDVIYLLKIKKVFKIPEAIVRRTVQKFTYYTSRNSQFAKGRK